MRSRRAWVSSRSSSPWLFLTTSGFWSLLVAAALFTAAETSGRGVKVTLAYLLMPDHRRLTVPAQVRVVQHITCAAGAGAAAWVLSTGTAGPYYAALAACCPLFAAAAWSAHAPLSASTEGAVATGGPAMITTLVPGAPAGGWAVPAVVFVAAAAPTPSLCRRAGPTGRGGTGSWCRPDRCAPGPGR
ncbi:hypothetical protein [Streptomyces sp. NPDC019937]|uniref:hypothetical protein n=1 Tax=Streptomyces sp. NPDC019937 TaxID=3154787 RepID=UPI0033E37CD1